MSNSRVQSGQLQRAAALSAQCRENRALALALTAVALVILAVTIGLGLVLMRPLASPIPMAAMPSATEARSARPASAPPVATEQPMDAWSRSTDLDPRQRPD